MHRGCAFAEARTAAQSLQWAEGTDPREVVPLDLKVWGARRPRRARLQEQTLAHGHTGAWHPTMAVNTAGREVQRAQPEPQTRMGLWSLSTMCMGGEA